MLQGFLRLHKYTLHLLFSLLLDSGLNKRDLFHDFLNTDDGDVNTQQDNKVWEASVNLCRDSVSMKAVKYVFELSRIVLLLSRLWIMNSSYVWACNCKFKQVMSSIKSVYIYHCCLEVNTAIAVEKDWANWILSLQKTRVFTGLQWYVSKSRVKVCLYKKMKGESGKSTTY